MHALVALGSNLGDRRAQLDSGLMELARAPGCRLLRASPWMETPPERPSDGGPFLNGAALLDTGLSPDALLRTLLSIERRCGRRRVPGRRGPRHLDLDLVLLGALRRSAPGLDLPHPRFRERAFVLLPAASIAPDLVDPATGKTLRQLRSALLS